LLKLVERGEFAMEVVDCSGASLQRFSRSPDVNLEERGTGASGQSMGLCLMFSGDRTLQGQSQVEEGFVREAVVRDTARCGEK
jgi:hypothetical protein